MNVSSRTRLKIIRRLALSCAACGWDQEVCDLHHIHGRGGEDPHRHSNLIYLCPNCHRLAHAKKLSLREVPTFDEQVGSRWKEAYYGG